MVALAPEWNKNKEVDTKYDYSKVRIRRHVNILIAAHRY